MLVLTLAQETNGHASPSLFHHTVPHPSPLTTKLTHTHSDTSSRREEEKASQAQTVAIFTGSIHVAEAARCTGAPAQ